MIRAWFRLELGLLLRGALWPLVAVAHLLVAAAVFGNRIEAGAAMWGALSEYLFAQHLVLMAPVQFALIAVLGSVALLREQSANMQDLIAALPGAAHARAHGKALAVLACAALWLLCALLGALLGLAIDRPGWPPRSAVVNIIGTFALIGIPNLLISTGLAFALLGKARNPDGMYVGFVLAIPLLWILPRVGDLVGGAVLARIVDPFGMFIIGDGRLLPPVAFGSNEVSPATSWTQLLDGPFWFPRFTCMLFAWVLYMLSCGGRQSFAATLKPSAAKRDVLRQIPERVEIEGSVSTQAPGLWAQSWEIARFDARSLVGTRTPAVLLCMGLLTFLLEVALNQDAYGWAIYMSPGHLARTLQSGFATVLNLVVVLIGALLLSREQRNRTRELQQALPLSGAARLLGKTLALSALAVVWQFAALASSMGLQFFVGTDVSLPIALQALALGLLQSVILAAWVATLGTLFTGLGGTLLGGIALIVANKLGSQTGLATWLAPLYLPVLPFSAFDGQDTQITHWSVRLAFTLALTLCALAFALLRTQRGMLPRQVWLGLLGCVGSGAASAVVLASAWTLGNQHPAPAREALVARERALVDSVCDKPQPHIAAVHMALDIRPDVGVATGHERISIVNDTGATLPVILLDVPEDVLSVDSRPGVRQVGAGLVAVDGPFQPGQTVELDLSIQIDRHWAPAGISGAVRALRSNGTVIFMASLLPAVGRGPERVTQEQRKEAGLPAKLECPGSKTRPMTTELEVTVPADYQVFSGGVRSPEIRSAAGVTHRFHQDSPQYPSAAILVGKWKTLRSDGPTEVILHVLPEHAANAKHMMQVARDAFNFYQKTYGPLPRPLRAINIVEIPAEYQFAQATPGGLIAVGESMGFTSDFDSTRSTTANFDQATDPIMHFVAHEIAHFWWGHALVAAPREGEKLLVEATAEYSALLYLRQDKKQFERALKEHAKNYNQSRHLFDEPEAPLSQQDRQPWIYYPRGSLVLMRLRQELGETRWQEALGGFWGRYGRPGAPMPTASDLEQALTESATPAQAELIHRLLDSTWTDVVVPVRAQASPTATGSWRVHVSLAPGSQSPVDRRVQFLVDLANIKAPIIVTGTVAAGSQSVDLMVTGQPIRLTRIAEPLRLEAGGEAALDIAINGSLPQ
jgi:hypothetical protein